MAGPFNDRLLTAGIVAARIHIEGGTRSYAAYARAMERDPGREIRPYLRSLYELVRHAPGFDATGMTPAAEVDTVERVLAEIEALDLEAGRHGCPARAPDQPDDREPLAAVTLAESDPTDPDYRHLSARVARNGDLVVAGQDIGPRVEAVWGHDDYEYYRTVASAHVPRLLLELLRDRFSRQRDFARWLESKGIPSRLETWP